MLGKAQNTLKYIENPLCGFINHSSDTWRGLEVDRKVPHRPKVNKG